MRIGIVGAGPAGLYFGLLIKRHQPFVHVDIFEQNPPDATYGWGVVFSKRALAFLEQADPASYRDIRQVTQVWDEQTIILNGVPVRIDGFGFSSLARIDLLTILQHHARQAGVNLHYHTRITDLAMLAPYDLVVGADGAHSFLRNALKDAFSPKIQELRNRYIWYGTRKPFDTLTLAFRRHETGHYVAHAYRYHPDLSTFIVECDASTWRQAQFETMSDQASRAFCEEIFSEELQGHHLLSNKSTWIPFRLITNQTWAVDRYVLLGDALRTVHFSIGSGTRTALEDAVALFHRVATSPTVLGALQEFATMRRPGTEAILAIARHSALWYEQMADKMSLPPVAFAYDYMMRGGEVTPERLRQRAPRFMAAYETQSGN